LLARIAEFSVVVAFWDASVESTEYSEEVSVERRGRSLLARIDCSVTMDPVTSPLIH